ncbi:hypothetical protein COV82_01010 [Candidatus Peregrinibacteria bacterium CG11_big_fil_rev_8_21_14_0_20_46_8]|nr:MAG: hypothetical protein COV82_01010 [Candidatus Peregrinibacteria bacterium CG11_big_fil_rev_8_21_14_0_20_46_8]
MNSSSTEQYFLKAYDDYSDAIFRYCYYRIGDRELAMDLMQDTFARTWNHVAEKGEIENIRAFLYRVAKNLIIDYIRKKRSISLEQLQESGFDPGEDKTDKMQDIFDGKVVLNVVDQLDEKYRDVVIMRYIDDLGPKEIAEILGIKENAVSVRLNRALEKLRTLLPSDSDLAHMQAHK